MKIRCRAISAAVHEERTPIMPGLAIPIPKRMVVTIKARDSGCQPGRNAEGFSDLRSNVMRNLLNNPEGGVAG